MVTKEGPRGMTSNPSIFDAAIAGSSDYDVAIAELRRSGPTDAKSVYESLAIADIRAAANIFRPVYDESDGGHGYVSMEVSPELAQTPPPPSPGHVALGNCRPVQRDGEGAGHRRRHLGHPGAARCWHQRQCCRATWSPPRYVVSPRASRPLRRTWPVSRTASPLVSASPPSPRWRALSFRASTRRSNPPGSVSHNGVPPGFSPQVLDDAHQQATSEPPFELLGSRHHRTNARVVK